MLGEYLPVLMEVLRKYGYTAQIWMVVEEFNELIKEICKLKRGQTTYRRLLEELIDSEIG